MEGVLDEPEVVNVYHRRVAAKPSCSTWSVCNVAVVTMPRPFVDVGLWYYSRRR
jgi:hypothetical protein